MTLEDEARSEILRRIRTALRDVPPDEPATEPVSRAYRFDDGTSHDEHITQFMERVGEYRATVHEVTAAGLAAAIAACARARNARCLVVPSDLPESWLTDLRAAGVELLVDGPEPLSNAQLDQSDGTLTGCALGIAQTGTIILDGGAYQGRRVMTLLPDYHLCVVDEAQVTGLVPQAVARLQEAVASSRRPLTFVSGPSATSDIELIRVEGVHGPRTLEVLVVRH